MQKGRLIEIKKGEVGSGLLIEEDGFLVLDKARRDSIVKEDVNGNSVWDVPEPFVVDAVFQKYGVKNANGRIYPEAVLKEQVSKYQEVIADNRAMGECYKGDALVLTQKKWKPISKLRKGELIYTLNVDTMAIEPNKVEEVIRKDYDGVMLHIVGKDIDDVVTPNHKYPVFFKDGGKMVFHDHVEANRLIEVGGYVPLFTDWIDLSTCTVTEEHYKGKVYCLNVKNHTFFVECNDNQHWTSNCNHPSESTIDLSRVSHRIIELHWEGKTLVGKLVLNTTEGFRKHGIVTSCGDQVANLLLNGYKIGVSSRGVGSVEQRLGQHIVGDDFELICWDIVSQPSTPNAFITQDGHHGLVPYLEGDGTVSRKTKIEEKVNKIKDILRG